MSLFLSLSFPCPISVPPVLVTTFHPTHCPSTLSLIFPFLSFHFHYLPYPLSSPAILLIFYRPAFSSHLPSLPRSSFAVPTACLLALFRHRGPGVPVALCPRYVTVSLYCYLIAASLLSIPPLPSAAQKTKNLKQNRKQKRDRNTLQQVGLQEEGLWTLSGRGN